MVCLSVCGHKDRRHQSTCQTPSHAWSRRSGKNGVFNMARYSFRSSPRQAPLVWSREVVLSRSTFTVSCAAPKINGPESQPRHTSAVGEGTEPHSDMRLQHLLVQHRHVPPFLDSRSSSPTVARHQTRSTYIRKRVTNASTTVNGKKSPASVP